MATKVPKGLERLLTVGDGDLWAWERPQWSSSPSEPDDVSASGLLQGRWRTRGTQGEERGRERSRLLSGHSADEEENGHTGARVPARVGHLRAGTAGQVDQIRHVVPRGHYSTPPPTGRQAEGTSSPLPAGWLVCRPMGICAQAAPEQYRRGGWCTGPLMTDGREGGQWAPARAATLHKALLLLLLKCRSGAQHRCMLVSHITAAALRTCDTCRPAVGRKMQTNKNAHTLRTPETTPTAIVTRAGQRLHYTHYHYCCALRRHSVALAFQVITARTLSADYS